MVARGFAARWPGAVRQRSGCWRRRRVVGPRAVPPPANAFAFDREAAQRPGRIRARVVGRRDGA
eukprot:546687-Lingulodinium_polyedra.AAC.1